MRIILLFILCLGYALLAGQSIPEITLRDIWTNLKFNSTIIEQPHFKNEGKTYTLLQENEIVEFDLLTGIKSKVILSGSEIQGLSNFMGSIGGYKFSPHEDMILLSSEQERINRRDTRSRYHIYNITNRTVNPLFNKKVTLPSFSPDGTKIAFIHNYNLYYKNLKNGSTTQVTFDGDQENILNGIGDWVQQEEFYLNKAYQWSSDGSLIAYYKIDQSSVDSQPLVQYNDLAYPIVEYQKYPKPGLAIPATSIYIYNVKSGKSHKIEIPIAGQYYIPLISWIPYENQLCLYTLNRSQNQLKSLLYDIKHQSLDIIYEENSITYLEPPREVIFDQSGNQYFISSQDGFNHVYALALDSKKIIDLTPGLIHVSKIYGIDPNRNVLFLQASKEDSRQRQLFKINLQSGEVAQLTRTPGVHEGWFNNSYDYLIACHSQFNSPQTYSVLKINEGFDTIRTIESNTHISQLINQYHIKNPKFFSFNNEGGIKLNGWMILPPDFSEEKKYPVLMYVYGGPGSQEVLNQWRGIEYWWFQMLAQKGYIIACIDNRGTGGRGTAFKNVTQGNLGYYEFQDQLSAAKYLGSLDFINSERIGIYGWSYGGYMALKCLIEGSSTFSMGISIAPVVDWKWFNAIYSERHMGFPKDNSQGYFNSNLLSRIHLLEDPLLLIHGLTDDIVHFQHTAELTKSLISYNKEYEAYLYPNRNHGIYGDNARLHMYSRMTDFIINNL